MKAIHYDPLVYPDPDRCDLFRFSKMRASIGSEAQYGFTTVDDYVRSDFFSFYFHVELTPYNRLPVPSIWCWYVHMSVKSVFTQLNLYIFRTSRLCWAFLRLCAFSSIAPPFTWMLIRLCKMELKLMLAHIFLEYDISYPAGVTERPKNVVFNGAIIPDTKALLIFRPR